MPLSLSPSLGWSENKRTTSKRHTEKKLHKIFAMLTPSVNTSLRWVKGCDNEEKKGRRSMHTHCRLGIATNKARPVATFLNCTGRWGIHVIDIENAGGILVMFVVYGGW